MSIYNCAAKAIKAILHYYRDTPKKRLMKVDFQSLSLNNWQGAERGIGKALYRHRQSNVNGIRTGWQAQREENSRHSSPEKPGLLHAWPIHGGL